MEVELSKDDSVDVVDVGMGVVDVELRVKGDCISTCASSG